MDRLSDKYISMASNVSLGMPLHVTETQKIPDENGLFVDKPVTVMLMTIESLSKLNSGVPGELTLLIHTADSVKRLPFKLRKGLTKTMSKDEYEKYVETSINQHTKSLVSDKANTV